MANKNNYEESVKRRTNYWEDFYCGSDVGVFIGGLWIEDIIGLQYTLSNNKAPVHGYMSESFDAVARGTYIVQGQFSVAFREMNYIENVLHSYKNSRALYKSYADDVETADEIIAAGQWNPTVSTTSVRPDRFGYVDAAFRKGVDPDGFDIVVQFGDQSGDFRRGTKHVITGCHITSQSMVLQATGEPIAEVYSFFARSINDEPNYSSITSPEEESDSIQPNPSTARYAIDPADVPQAEEYLAQAKAFNFEAAIKEAEANALKDESSTEKQEINEDAVVPAYQPEGVDIVGAAAYTYDENTIEAVIDYGAMDQYKKNNNNEAEKKKAEEKNYRELAIEAGKKAVALFKKIDDFFSPSVAQAAQFKAAQDKWVASNTIDPNFINHKYYNDKAAAADRAANPALWNPDPLTPEQRKLWNDSHEQISIGIAYRDYDTLVDVVDPETGYRYTGVDPSEL